MEGRCLTSAFPKPSILDAVRCAISSLPPCIETPRGVYIYMSCPDFFSRENVILWLISSTENKKIEPLLETFSFACVATESL